MSTRPRWQAISALFVALLVSGLVVTRSLAATPPPTPTITSGPTGTTTSTSATFRFNVGANIKGLTYACSLDGAAFTPCSSGVGYRGLADGAHTFRVQSVLAGTAGTPASRTWSVDSKAPIVSTTFPVGAVGYTTTAFAAGCPTSGLCGTVTDATAVTSVTVSIRQGTGNYWSGTGFTSRTETFLTARLAATGVASTTWSYGLVAPAVGSYTVRIKATDSLGTSTATPSSTTFSIINPSVTPPPPTITVKPTNPSPDPAPTFSFTSTVAGVAFQCVLDGGAAVACNNGSITYADLSAAPHCFAVVAVAGGVPSPTTSYCWTIVVANGPFTITGSPAAALSPGGPPAAIDLSITNPFPFSITVTSITISVDAATNKAGCDGSSNVVVTRGFSGTATIPANSTTSLSELAPAVAAAQWPQVRMLDTASDQDVCKGATFSFTYSGTARQ